MPSILKHLWTTIHMLFKFTWWNEPTINKGLFSLHLECSHLKTLLSHYWNQPLCWQTRWRRETKGSKAGWRSSHHPHPWARPSPSSRNGRNTMAPWSAPSAHTIIPPRCPESEHVLPKTALHKHIRAYYIISSFHLWSCMPGGSVWIEWRAIHLKYIKCQTHF